MRFSMLYSGEQILSFKSCLVFYAGDSLNSHPAFQKFAYGPAKIDHINIYIYGSVTYFIVQ